jgi:hypothetical protein
MKMVDLWPADLVQPLEQKAPVTILREQATLLGQKTSNLVEGRVVEGTTQLPGLFVYSFQLIAPVLKNYSYRLFSIRHDINLYPLQVSLDDDLVDEVFGDRKKEILLPDGSESIMIDRTVSSEEEFLEALSKIFGASKTRHIINALIAQSTGYPPTPAFPTIG